MSKRRFATLTGIRGAAAVWVVVFHAYPALGGLFEWPERPQVPIVRDGFMAVDLFFVLSGFVLSHAYADGFHADVRGTYKHFLPSRIRRIFPLHWVCLGIMVVLVKSFPHHWWGPGPFTSSSLADAFLLIQNWIPSTAQAWNHPAWSLSAEWFAYLLFPLLGWILGFLDNRFLAIGGAVLALLVLEAWLLGSGSETLDHVGKGGMVRCVCEFVAGVLIWKAIRGGTRAVSGSGDALVILALAILGVSLAIPSVQIAAPFGFAALITGCVLSSRLAEVLFGNQLLIGLGEISFSIYLIHIPTLGVLADIAERTQLREAAFLPRFALLVATPAAVLGAAVLLWHFVEVPGRTLLRSSIGGAEGQRAESRLSVAIAFWLTVVAMMTFSETAADFLSTTVGCGVSTVLLLAVAASIVVKKIEFGSLGPFGDWSLILCIGMAGTTLSDFLDVSVGLGDLTVCFVLALPFLAAQRLWRLSSELDHPWSSWKARIVFGWLTLLLAAALGTSLSDLLTDRFGLYYSGGSLLILSGLVCIALAAPHGLLRRGPLFWAAFVLTRPLGVTFGDALTMSHPAGGLQFGPGAASLVLMALIIVLMPIARRPLLTLFRHLNGSRHDPIVA